MNQLSYTATLCLCLLCLFVVVIHAVDTTKITNVEIVSSTIEVQQEESSTPTKTSPNNNDPIDILPSPSPTNPTSITNNSSITCRVIGECVPCAVFEVKLDSYCKEFGNKEPIECQYDTPGEHIGGPLPTFQACKRVKRLERTRYFEFQFVNILIAFLSCSILLWRRRKLAEDRYRKLSRRIRGGV